MKLLIGIGLALAGIVGLILTSSIGITCAFIIAIVLWKWVALYQYVAYAFKSIGYACDICGNVVLAPVLNRIFSYEDAQYQFGSYKHTISLVIAYKYYYSKKLNPLGMKLFQFLEFCEKGHCLSALMDFETKEFYIKPNQI